MCTLAYGTVAEYSVGLVKLTRAEKVREVDEVSMMRKSPSWGSKEWMPPLFPPGLIACESQLHDHLVRYPDGKKEAIGWAGAKVTGERYKASSFGKEEDSNGLTNV